MSCLVLCPFFLLSGFSNSRRRVRSFTTACQRCHFLFRSLSLISGADLSSKGNSMSLFLMQRKNNKRFLFRSFVVDSTTAQILMQQPQQQKQKQRQNAHGSNNNINASFSPALLQLEGRVYTSNIQPHPLRTDPGELSRRGRKEKQRPVWIEEQQQEEEGRSFFGASLGPQFFLMKGHLPSSSSYLVGGFHLLRRRRRRRWRWPMRVHDCTNGTYLILLCHHARNFEREREL